MSSTIMNIVFVFSCGTTIFWAFKGLIDGGLLQCVDGFARGLALSFVLLYVVRDHVASAALMLLRVLVISSIGVVGLGVALYISHK